MSTAQRRGWRQSKLATWQQLQQTESAVKTDQNIKVPDPVIEPDVVDDIILTTDEVESRPTKEELPKIVKKTKSK